MYRIRTGSAGALVLLALSAGCMTDEVTAPAVTSPAASVLATGGACEAVKAADPSAVSGEYDLEVQGRALRLYCLMSASPAREYLTLPAGPTNNYSNYSNTYASPPVGRVGWFSKIRVDPVTLKVDVNDFTFANFTGVATHPDGGRNWPVYTIPFGTAVGCAGGLTGHAHIDLSGTPFSLGANPASQFGKWHAAPNPIITVTSPQIVDLRGGGSCGWVSWPGAYNPFNQGGEIWKLQLTYLGNARPVIVLPETAFEGSPVTVQATDIDGDALTITSNWGDGATGSLDHTYADDGAYTLTVTASDGKASTTATGVVQVANVAPTLTSHAPAEIMVGETYRGSGSFADPGADSWTGAANFGTVVVTGMSYTVEHTFMAAGEFDVVVTIEDDDGGSGAASALVNVLSPAAASAKLEALVEDLVTSGALAPTDAKPLTESLESALAALDKDKASAALGMLGAFDNKLKALLKSKRISQSDYDALIGYSDRLKKSIDK